MVESLIVSCAGSVSGRSAAARAVKPAVAVERHDRIFPTGVGDRSVKIMEKVKLDRLSELTAISRERELTEAEKRERETLRNEYRAAVTGNLRTQLEHTTIVEPDGTRISLSKGEKSMKTSGEE